ncbi:MAG TPA: heme-binding beta-barrel domain-containing protein [bacterium]|nr:heme-binding beta-barrel domain-containing protein [bacterium]
MDKNTLKDFGPLRALVGTWEGVKGDDTAPSDDRGTEKNKYRERMRLEPILPVENHEQKLFGLRYFTQAFRLREKNPFHDEVGYWLWDPKTKQVMKGLVIPRGMTTLAGGKAAPGAKKFKLKATFGSKTYGICSNPFLDKEFRTMAFEITMVLGKNEFSYDQTTFIRIKGQKSIFKHRDKNTLKRIKS